MFTLPGLQYFILCLIVTLLVLGFGYLIVETICPGFKLTYKALLSAPTYFGYIYLLYLINMVSKGIIFQSNTILILSQVIPFTILLYINRHNINLFFSIRKILDKKYYLFFLLIILCTYTYPIMKSPSGIVWVPGDMGRHLEMINQILTGNTQFHGVYEHIEHNYPWLFHVILSSIQAIFPLFSDRTVRIFLAYNVVNILTVIIGFLGAYALSSLKFKKEIERKISVFLTMFSGGLGFIFYQGRFNYHNAVKGDMILGYPYNGTLMNVAPAWPRHLSYSLYIVWLYFIIKYFKENKEPNKNALKAIIAIIGSQVALIQTVPFFIINLTLLSIFIIKLSEREIEIGLVQIVILMALIMSPYLVPLFTQSRNIATSLPTQMTPYDFAGFDLVGALGQVVLYCPLGLLLAYGNKTRREYYRKEWDFENKLAIVLLVLIYISMVNSANGFNWSFMDLLLRQHKIWHLLYPILALYSTIGVSYIFNKLGNGDEKPKMIRLSKGAYYAFLLVFIIIGSGSPVLSSILQGNDVATSDINQEYKNTQEDNLMSLIQKTLDKTDVVATPLTPSLSRRVGYFTGSYLMVSDYLRIKINESSGIPTQNARIRDIRALYSNSSTVARKLEIIEKYNLTHIVAQTLLKRVPTANITEIHETNFLGERYVLYILKKGPE